jgi:hypothetical protein
MIKSPMKDDKEPNERGKVELPDLVWEEND